MQLSNEVTDKHLTIGELVTENWRKAEVFKKYSIDFCCGGKGTVAEACQKKGLDPIIVEAELALMDVAPAEQSNFNTWSLDKLAEYIITKHHNYVDNSVGFLVELSAKVARVHGDNHPELIEINQLTLEVCQELLTHMEKENSILFPYISRLAEAERKQLKISPPPFGTLANPIAMMEADHLSAGNGMEKIEKLSVGFAPPEDACSSYRVLFSKLQEFYLDLIQHVHLENNILFPRALKLEKSLLENSTNIFRE